MATFAKFHNRPHPKAGALIYINVDCVTAIALDQRTKNTLLFLSDDSTFSVYETLDEAVALLATSVVRTL